MSETRPILWMFGQYWGRWWPGATGASVATVPSTHLCISGYSWAQKSGNYTYLSHCFYLPLHRQCDLKMKVFWCHAMKTASHWYPFRITDPLPGETTGSKLIYHGSDRWDFDGFSTVNLDTPLNKRPVKWDALTLTWRHRNVDPTNTPRSNNVINTSLLRSAFADQLFCRLLKQMANVLKNDIFKCIFISIWLRFFPKLAT